jgi:hypothetical protein
LSACKESIIRFSDASICDFGNSCVIFITSGELCAKSGQLVLFLRTYFSPISILSTLYAPEEMNLELSFQERSSFKFSLQIYPNGANDKT